MSGHFEVTLVIPRELRMTLTDESPLVNTIPVESYSIEVLQKALCQGFLKALGDVSRGKDEHERPNDDATWHALRDKRMKAWEAGEWALRGAGERGDSNLRFIKEHYFFECLTQRGMKASAVEKEIKEMVKAQLGDDTKATFDNFLTAVAMANVEDGGDIEALKESIEAGLTERARAAEAERQKAAKKLDIGGILVMKK